MPEPRQLDGGCQCGAVRYRTTGEPIFAAICHCSTCRRACGAPAVAWAMFAEDQVAFLKDRPKTYASSPEVRRGFCAQCGTPLSFTASFIPGLIDVTVGSLDDPAAIQPSLHSWDSRRLPWMKFADGLPAFPEFPPQE